MGEYTQVLARIFQKEIVNQMTHFLVYVRILAYGVAVTNMQWKLSTDPGGIVLEWESKDISVIPRVNRHSSMASAPHPHISTPRATKLDLVRA